MGSFKNEKIKQIQSDYHKVVEQREKLVSYRRRGLVRRLTAFGIIVSVVGYLMISTFLSQTSAHENKIMEREHLQSELKEMKKKQGKLEEEVVKLNDDEYIAKIARRDYFLSEENEIIFSIPQEPESY
jgi:cell division protein DivIC